MSAQPEMTYEQRAALYILGVMAIHGSLDPEFLDSPHSQYLEGVASYVGDALMEAIYVLGCPRHLTLPQILDLASTHGDREFPAEKDGAE